MLSYLSSLLPSSSRKRLRVEVADEDDEKEEEEEVDEEENPITKRRVVKQLSTKTRNALKQSLEISLARVHEACFYFYAMGANEEGENQLKVLLRNVIEQAAVDTSCWVFLSQFQVLSSDTARVIHLSDSEIEVEYLAMANDAKANHTCFRLRFCVRLASVGDIKMTTDVEVDWKPSDEVASIARGRSPSSRLIYQIASGLLKKKGKTTSLAPKTFQSSVETVMEKLNMAPSDSKTVTMMTSLAFHAASKVEIFPPAPIKFIRGSLKKMQTNFHTFTFISLFSGCGVSARGLSDAGGLCVLFAEKDSYRREILKKNNPHLEAWQFVEKVEDINQDLIDRVVAKYKHVDLIEGGVRCDDVSSKNFKRGEKSFEEVAFPFLLVGKIETMVERAHMKAYEEIMKKTRKSRLQASIPIPTPCVVLIENVTGLAKRVNNGMPYICFLFQMCVQKKMSFAVRTLNAHDAGLDHWYQFMCSSARLICSYDERASYEYYEQHHHLRIFKKTALMYRSA